MNNEEFDNSNKENTKQDNIVSKKVKEEVKKRAINLGMLLVKSPVFWGLIGILFIMMCVFIIQMSLTIMKLGVSYDNQLYSNSENAFWSIYTDEDGEYDFYAKAEQLQNDYHTSNNFGKNEFMIEQKLAVMYETYTQKMAGTTLRTIWLRATLQAGFYSSSYNDYYDFDDPITGEIYNDFSDCVDFDSDFANYTEEERDVRIYVDMNIADNCTYNEEVFYQKDFTERYPHSTKEDDPNLGTDRNSYQDTDSNGTPIPDYYLEEEDTIRGLVNQMVSKAYTCVFIDYYWKDEAKVIVKVFSPEEPLEYGGQWLLFPTQQNLYQVGFLEDACYYFSEIVPLTPTATNRDVIYDHTYVLDMDNYKDYLLNSEFFETRLPDLFLTLNEEETEEMIQSLYDEVVKFAEYYEDMQTSDNYYTDGGYTPGADIGSFNSYNASLPTSVAPLSSIRITSCFDAVRYLSGETNVHTGLDFGATIGTPIYASWPGTVVYERDTYANHALGTSGNSSHTNMVNILAILLDPIEDSNGITHSNLIVRYIHINTGSISKNGLSVGSKVNAGDVITEVGHNGWSTGPHLHLEMFYCKSGGTGCMSTSSDREYSDPATALGLEAYCN